MLLTPWLAALRMREAVACDCRCRMFRCLPTSLGLWCGRGAISVLKKQWQPVPVPVRTAREHHWRARQRLH